MRAIMKCLIGSMLATAMALTVGGFAQDQHKSSSPQLQRFAQGRDRDKDRDDREEHPVIEESIRQLEHVKDELEHKAAHDFKGHRVAAIRHIDEALHELHTALEVDKK
jgi:hypothetical protein